MAICEAKRVIFKDQPYIKTSGEVEKRCLIVLELEIGPDKYKPVRYGPELPISAIEAEIIFHNWVRYPLIK